MMDPNSNYHSDAGGDQTGTGVGQTDGMRCCITVNTSIAIDNGSESISASSQLIAPNRPRERSNSASERHSPREQAFDGGGASYLRPDFPGANSLKYQTGRKRSLYSQADSPVRSSCHSLAGQALRHSPPSRSRSHYGSEFYMGSSVTFCNILGTSDLGMAADDKDNGLRRSCSITLVYPTETLLEPSDGGTRSDWSRSYQRTGSTTRQPYQYPTSLLLAPPTITFDRVTAASPMTPTLTRYNKTILGTHSPFGSAYQLQSQSKAIMVTPRGSFLAINQSPLEFRESMLSINYPNYCGELNL